ncbi:MAG: SLBB domain-containing protein, partial [Planctomycetales bacterium]|nr:SLBB domain-containing protein [Planctomycetales bacterium]
DESEPGTFKDRDLLLRTPWLILEGMILGGLVVGADKGYVYIRHEYHEQIEAVKDAIEHARAMGACGPSIFGSQRSFDLEVFVSPGGYICGEQTALIEAMEDHRAEPRNRPPQLQTNGLWDKPTLLNNVETFAWVPIIRLRERGKWFAEAGKEGFLGRRFFSISVDVNRPGAYEVPNGITLRELIEDLAGGVRHGRPLKAVAASGPSGGFLPAKLPVSALRQGFVAKLPLGTTHFDLLDWQLDIGLSREMGLMLGAGIVIYADDVDMVDQAWACSRFYRDESCGKCVPCRLGSTKLTELVTRIKARECATQEIAAAKVLVNELAQTMALTSICGLGQVAAAPLRTLLEYFPEEVEARGQTPS